MLLCFVWQERDPVQALHVQMAAHVMIVQPAKYEIWITHVYVRQALLDQIVLCLLVSLNKQINRPIPEFDLV